MHWVENPEAVETQRETSERTTDQTSSEAVRHIFPTKLLLTLNMQPDSDFPNSVIVPECAPEAQ